MDTSFWGPHLWAFSFSMIMCYPDKIDINDKKHIKIMNKTKNFFELWKYILPCKYCRYSYKHFYEVLPIENSLYSRKELFLWLYTIKDMVNKKLREQQICKYNYELEKILQSKRYNKLTEKKQLEAQHNLFNKIVTSKESPPFEQIYNFYSRYKTL